MKAFQIANSVVALSTFLVSCEVLLAAEKPHCDETAALARMARAQSSAVLAQEKREAGDGYTAGVVFASRSLDLRPKDRHAAVLLLNLIPQDEKQQTAWMTLGDSLCSTEPVSDMKVLGRLSEGLPRHMAQAVLLVPEKLPDYVAYALISTQDPHSDYAIQMQNVCRAEHPGFIKAVAGLPPDKKDWFIKHVFDPDGCRAVALPEAE
jgi:hypothetical protein